MIKTIKVKKKMRLDELLKYVWDNELNRIEAVSSSGRFKLKFIDNKSILVNSESTLGPFGSTVSLSTTEWEIEVEEEITEDTPFEDIVILHINGISHLGQGAYHSIRSIRCDYPTVAEIHTLMNGKIQLIWEAE